MRLFSDTAFFTVSRMSDDSSPNTMRPVQSTTTIPSFVFVANLIAFKRSFVCPAIPQDQPVPALRVTHQPIACALLLASLLGKCLPAGMPPSRIIVSSGS